MKLLILIVTLVVQAPKPIDIEMVRKDMLSKPHISPEEFIKKAKPAAFKVMYAGKLCFVHLSYRSPGGDPFTRSSDLLVYRYTENNWVFDNLVPAWSDVELMDPAKLVFLANIKACDGGPCVLYQAISHYDGKELFLLRKYSGFDKTAFYTDIIKTGKKDKVKFAVGDTISNFYTVYDFVFEQYQTSFTLKHNVETIQSISKDAIRKKVMLDTFERVIANY